MKKIGFIGTFDKNDLITYTAKLLQSLGLNVMVIDASLMQKTKYIIPSINPTRSYVTSFEGIDFAVGFTSWEDIERYLGIKFDINDEYEENTENKIKNPYDYVLINIDTKETYENFDMRTSEKNYFVSSFDLYSLNRGITIFEDIKVPVKLTKILFSYDSVTKDEDEYLNSLSLEYKIEWNEYVLYFQINNEDSKVIQENQRLQKIRFKRLTNNYKESLAYLVQDITKTDNVNKIRKIMRDLG